MWRKPIVKKIGQPKPECPRFLIEIKGHSFEGCELGEEIEGRTRATKGVVADMLAEMLQQNTLLFDNVNLSEEVV